MNTQFFLHLFGYVLIGVGHAVKTVPGLLGSLSDVIVGLGVALSGGTGVAMNTAANLPDPPVYVKEVPPPPGI